MVFKCSHCKKEINIPFDCEIWCGCRPRVKQKMIYEGNKQEIEAGIKISKRYVLW